HEPVRAGLEKPLEGGDQRELAGGPVVRTARHGRAATGGGRRCGRGRGRTATARRARGRPAGCGSGSGASCRRRGRGPCDRCRASRGTSRWGGPRRPRPRTRLSLPLPCTASLAATRRRFVGRTGREPAQPGGVTPPVATAGGGAGGDPPAAAGAC